MRLTKTARRARTRRRRRLLGGALTAEELLKFRQRIHVVRYGNQVETSAILNIKGVPEQGFCWIYMSKSKGGIGALDVYGQKIPGHYGMMGFRGKQIGTHRFALAVQLGCPLLALEGYQAGHLPYEVCMGAPCCRPEHMVKQTSLQNTHQRDMERKKHPRRPALVKLMYPSGLPIRMKEQT